MKRKLTYKFLSIVQLLMVSILLNAQHGNIDSFDSIYQIQLDYVEYLADQQSKDINELTEYKWFGNWASHFATKLDEDGGINKFGEVIYDYYKSNTDVEGDIDFIWEYNSPDGLWGNWEGTLQQGSGQGLIISLWIDENDLDHIMAGGQFCGGLWETKDGGNEWENISENEPMIQGISSIFVNSDSNIYITTAYDAERPRGYTNGLYYTVDGGANWQLNECNTYDPFEANPDSMKYYPYGHNSKSPRKFLQNPSNDSIMYLLTPYRLSISIDKGKSWTVLINKEKNNPGIYSVWHGTQFFDDMVLDPFDSSTLYIAGPEAFRIENNGQNITNITSSLLPDPTDTVAWAMQVDAHINHPDSIWFTLVDTSTSKTYIILCDEVSPNNYNYTIKPTGLTTGSAYLQCEVSPKNGNHIVIGGAQPYCYNFSNGDYEIYQRRAGFHNDIRSTEWPNTGDSTDFVLFGTDGGATKIFNVNPDDNTDFIFEYIANDSTDGIRNLDVQGFDVSRYGKELMVTGTEHNGMIVKIDSTWVKPNHGGDYQSIKIDQGNSEEFYATRFATLYLEHYHSFGKARDSFYIYNDHIYNYPLLFFKPNDNKTLYAGYYKQILEFDTKNLSLNIEPDTHNFPLDIYDYQYIKECGVNDDLKNIFFVSTDRYWRSWPGEDWNCNPSIGKPHTLALLKVEIEQNGSLSYHDISDNLNIDKGLCGGSITGITIELNGADTIVYTSFGNTSYDNSDPQKNKKAYYSKDLGETWFAMADGLPPDIPANDIQYHKESGMLYLINDVGVYYFDRSDSTWMNITYDLPPMSYSQIRFSHQRAKILVSSHAKGIWEADLPCFSDSADITITSNTTWNHSVAAHGNITIDSGAVLTVKKEVYMPTSSNVFVKPGGKLIVDGGKFTHACGERWEGIEVWGNSSAIQLPTTQGWVEVKNGGTIEHAKVGIFASKSTPIGYVATYDGGVIKCDSAFFINNQIAIIFKPYTYPSASGFYNTTFETNNDYFGTNYPDDFMEIWDMASMDITYCSFINNNNDVDNDEHNGVFCRNTDLNIWGRCTGGDPCTNWEHGLFKNLDFGVHAYYTSSSSAVLDVRNTDFENNFRGMYISGSDVCRLTSNNFEINEDFETDGGCGLYLDNCTGYWVEENLFMNDSATATGLGIVVNNSGGDANEIYRNNFANLEQGISAQEQNRDTRIRIQGLQILCNDFDSCDADIFVPEPSVSSRGIAPNQGVANSTDPEDMAGNEFFYEESSTDFDDINNEGSGIDYFYDNNLIYDVMPEDYYGVDLEAVNTIPDWSPAYGCPSQISSGGGGTKSTNLSYQEQLVYYTGLVESTETTLLALIDGGNTETLNTEVELSMPPETMEIYTELMNESPYLSETVVESAIEKETVLPNAMVRDVMVANPQSANSDQLIEKLEERVTPMPNYMRAQILQGKSIVSLKQELESQLANYKLKQSRAINGIVREYLADTINPVSSTDSIVALYESVNDKGIKYRLAFLHLQREEYDLGTTVLDAILTGYELSTEETSEHDIMVDYFNLVKGIKQDSRTELDANEDEIQELVNIEQLSNGIVGAYARNVLLALEEIEYLAPIQLPNLYKSSKEAEELLEIINSEAPSQLSVFPNPSKGYVIIEYHQEMEKDGTIEIKDVNGITIKKVYINILEDQVIVGTHDWKPGVYIASLIIDGISIESCKFTLVK